MKLIDTHTHLYLDEFNPDRGEVIARAKREGIAMLFLPNIDASTFEPMLSMCRDLPGICFPMAGLHPTSVKENYLDQLKQIEACLQKEKFIAIGEVGIDLYWDKGFFDQQKEAFIIQISYAKKYKLPIVIHARESFTEIFEILDKHADDSLSGVFHSFTGGLSEIDKIKEYGFYFGINGILTYKNSGLDKIVKNIPRDRILLETDSPYLTPVPKRGKRNESAYLPYIVDKLSDILGMGRDEVADLTTANALNLFKIPS